MKVGDIVRLNAGGPGMTVTGVSDEIIHVTYWEDKRNDGGIFGVGTHTKALVDRGFPAACLKAFSTEKDSE